MNRRWAVTPKPPSENDVGESLKRFARPDWPSSCSAFLAGVRWRCRAASSMLVTRRVTLTRLDEMATSGTTVGVEEGGHAKPVVSEDVLA